MPQTSLRMGRGVTPSTLELLSVIFLFGVQFRKVDLKVRQIPNDFFKPTFLPNNEQTKSTLLLVDLFSFVFWKKVKSPKRHFEINWPLAWSNDTKWRLKSNTYEMSRRNVADKAASVVANIWDIYDNLFGSTLSMLLCIRKYIWKLKNHIV